MVLPESPKYLVERFKYSEAIDCYNIIARINKQKHYLNRENIRLIEEKGKDIDKLKTLINSLPDPEIQNKYASLVNDSCEEDSSDLEGSYVHNKLYNSSHFLLD